MQSGGYTRCGGCTRYGVSMLVGVRVRGCTVGGECWGKLLVAGLLVAVGVFESIDVRIWVRWSGSYLGKGQR